MSGYSQDLETSASPEKVRSALIDFSERRPQLWPGIEPSLYEVYSIAETTADVREGNKVPGGKVWAVWSAGCVPARGGWILGVVHQTLSRLVATLSGPGHGVAGVKGFGCALLAAVLWLCGCASQGGPVTGHFGVVAGFVLTAPVCPVERIGQECPPRPVSGAAVVALDGDAVRGSTLTDSTGAFQLRLPDGRYVIRASNVGGYASTATEPVVISPTPVHITLVVDSGIR